jgi:hypothetical protein
LIAERRHEISSVALVTGSFSRVADLGVELKRAGFRVTEVVAPERLDEVCAALGPGSVDCYAQLSWDVESSAATAIERLGAVLGRDLIHRSEAVTRVLPLLRPDACIVLVAGHHLPGTEGPDDRHARDYLLRLLARLIRAENAGPGPRVAVVDDECPPHDIAEIGLHGGPNQARRISKYAALEEEWSFTDWRSEVLSRWGSPESE